LSQSITVHTVHYPTRVTQSASAKCKCEKDAYICAVLSLHHNSSSDGSTNPVITFSQSSPPVILRVFGSAIAHNWAS